VVPDASPGYPPPPPPLLAPDEPADGQLELHAEERHEMYVSAAAAHEPPQDATQAH
jgi:hypothetical protein